MVKEVSLNRIKDFQAMLDILRPKCSAWNEGTAERKILQNQIDKLDHAIAKERALIRGLDKPEKNSVTPDMIDRAKHYPIDSLLPGKGMQCCLWHDEKTPSMSVNRKHNRVRCFGACARSWDTIDVYMKLHGVSFADAVRALQ